MSRMRSYCTFVVDGLLMGVDVLEVQEVVRHREPTRVPTAPGAVRGLINLRGQIVTLLDLRLRLGLNPDQDHEPRPGRDQRMNVVVRASGGPVGLIVDEVGDVLEVDRSRIDRTPETVPSTVRRLATGLLAVPGRPMLVLDIARVVEEEDFHGR